MKYLVMSLCLICSRVSISQGFLKFYNLSDEYTTQYISDFWFRNDTIHAHYIGTKNDQSKEYISLVLDKHGDIISSTPSPRAGLLAYIRWYDDNTDIRVIPVPGDDRITFASLDSNRMLIDSISVQLTDYMTDDLYFNQLVKTNDYWILGCTVFSPDQYPVFFWFDVNSFELIEIQLFDDNVSSINEIVVWQDEVYGIAYDGDELYNLVKVSRQHDLELIREVHNDIHPGESIRRWKLELEVDHEGNFIVGNWRDRFVTSNQLTYYEDSIKVINPLNVLHGGNGNIEMIPVQDSGLITLISVVIVDDFSFDDPRVVIISYINKEKKVLWSTKIRRFDDDGDDLLDFYYGVIREDENYFYIPVINANSSVCGLLKISKIDGCIEPDCLPSQVVGYYPPPHDMVSHRHLYHMYDKNSHDRYRYTYISPSFPDIGGTLLRSDDMHGDNWYSTGRIFRSTSFGAFQLNYETDTIIDHYYSWGLDIGFENQFWSANIDGWLYQKVIDKELINFNDGRQMRKLTLQCYHNSVLIDSIPTITWIEHIGDPNDLFNGYSACSSTGSEVVTCFYESGDLMWSHPYFSDCSLTNIVDLESSNDPTSIVYPNPTSDFLNITEIFAHMIIVDSEGNIVFQKIDAVPSEPIDVSSFNSGMYYIYDKENIKGSVVPFVKR